MSSDRRHWLQQAIVRYFSSSQDDRDERLFQALDDLSRKIDERFPMLNESTVPSSRHGSDSRQRETVKGNANGL